MKKNIGITIILAIVTLLLLRCWIVIIGSEIMAGWKHYLGLLLFGAICVMFFKNTKIATISAGVYLLLATLNIIALTPSISTTSFGIGPVFTPKVQLMSLGLFILYFLLNIDSLFNIYLDYKGIKGDKKTDA